MPLKVIRRFINSVARRAIDQASVIDIGWLPTGGDVTGAALTWIVHGRRISGVACGAVGETSMIEGR